MTENETGRSEQNSTEKITILQNTIGYAFKDLNYLILALTHKSYAHEQKIADNERLEFLGDAILQFVISDHLMREYPELPEGMLSKFRSVLVSEKGLSLIAGKIGLGSYVRIGKGEESTGGRDKKSILADALEALISAVYLDSQSEFGIEKTKGVVLKLFHEDIIVAEKTFTTVDYKTDIQEFVQKNKLGELSYKVIEEIGPDHDKEFVTALLISDLVYGVGRGKSKKMSEQNAAINAFDKIKEESDH
jgi:ribonuclease III